MGQGNWLQQQQKTSFLFYAFWQPKETNAKMSLENLWYYYCTTATFPSYRSTLSESRIFHKFLSYFQDHLLICINLHKQFKHFFKWLEIVIKLKSNIHLKKK